MKRQRKGNGLPPRDEGRCLAPSGRWGRIAGFLLQDVRGEGRSKVTSAFINRAFLKFHKLRRPSDRKSHWTSQRDLGDVRVPLLPFREGQRGNEACAARGPVEDEEQNRLTQVLPHPRHRQKQHDHGEGPGELGLEISSPSTAPPAGLA